MSAGERPVHQELLDTAEVALARAGEVVGGQRAALLREASRAFFAAGDEARGRAAARDAFDAWPADDAAFTQALRDAAADVDRLAHVLAARADAVPAEAAACRRARADALLAFGRAEAALAAYRACLADAPGEPGVLAGLVEAKAELGDAEGALAAARRLVEMSAGGESERAALELAARVASRFADRGRARALSAAGDPRAEEAWQALFDAEQADGEAFDRLSELMRSRHDAERWLALAARHERALHGRADAARRRDLRCERAAALTDLGRLEEAEAAWQAALALDPRCRRALRGLRALLDHRGDHAGAAAAIAAEAEAVDDAEEAAELLLDEARVRLERLGDRERAARAATAAMGRLAHVAPRRSRRLLARARRLGIHLEEPSPPPSAVEAVASGPTAPEAAGSEESVPRREPLQSLVQAAHAAGDRELALELARRASEQAPRDVAVLSTLSAALAAVGRDHEAIGVEERLLALAPPGPERVERYAALAARAQAAGDVERALRLHERVRAARPGDVSVLAALARLHEAPEDWFSLAAVARELERAGAADALGPLAVAAGRALVRSGDPGAGMRCLRAAAAAAPHDREIRDELAAACELAGDVEGAERARSGAREGSTSVESPAGSVPSAHRRPVAPPPVEDALARLRAAPFDLAAAGEVASLARLFAGGAAGAELARLTLVARSAVGLAAFSSATTPRSGGAPRCLHVSEEARGAAAHRTARSPLALLLALLAPFLEPLFPVDLARRGVAASHRLGPERAPEMLASLDDARRALGSRPCAAFLIDTDGLEIAIENTRPPSLVLPVGLAHTAPAERRFLLARALALVDLGWALAGKFAACDLAMICELACRFAGTCPTSPLLDEARARPFLAALERNTPDAARSRAAELGPDAVRALPEVPPHALAAALRQTAARVALLHVGDVHSALAALVSADGHLADAPRAQAFEEPELLDLAAFALSEPYLRHRAEAERRA